MARIVVRIAGLWAACAFAMPVFAQVQPASDVIYVLQSNAAGTYLSTPGTIVELTPTYAIVSVDGVERLYTPDVVKRIRLAERGPDACPDGGGAREACDDLKKRMELWRRHVHTYWNRDIPLLVQVAQSLPVVGQGLKFLDRVSPLLSAIIASVLLLGACVWGLYRFRDAVLVTSESHRLNREKLQLEIDKLRRDLGTPGGAVAAPAAASHVVQPEAVPAPPPPSRASALPRGWTRLSSRFMSAQDQHEFAEMQRASFRVTLETRPERVPTRYRRSAIGYRIALVLLWLYGPMFLVASPAVFFVDSAEDDMAALGAGAIFYMLLGAYFVYLALRLHVKLRILRAVYLEAVAQGTHQREHLKP